MKPKEIKTTHKITDPVFKQHGEPFLIDPKNGMVSLNDRAVAVKCARMHQVSFDPKTRAFQRYFAEAGLWKPAFETEVKRMLDDLLVELGDSYKQQDFVRHINAGKLSSLCKMLQPHDAKPKLEATTGLVHVRNGVVDLAEGNPKLLAHDAKFPFHHGGDVVYDKKAKCPGFLKELLGSALKQDDIGLVQKYCGSMLLGPNSSQGILVIRGTPGGGKSTLLSIIEKIIGEPNVAYLRTAHLSGRFESSAFLGKRLLVGKDVPSDTLAVSGARMLKSLVGGDLMQAEIKFNPEKQTVRGDFHVIIVSNNKLRLALDGDEEAWRRRLLVVDFNSPKPGRPIPNFAEKLLAEEASGILNWLIEGAQAFQNEMSKQGRLGLNEVQKERVQTLIENSDSVAQFVAQAIVPKTGRDVSSQEMLLGYYDRCRRKEWTPVASQTFRKRVPDLLAVKYRITRRNDIQREGRAVRGFKNVTLV